MGSRAPDSRQRAADQLPSLDDDSSTERLSAALVEAHERIIHRAGPTSRGHDTPPGSADLTDDGAELLDAESNAELLDLADCIEQLERARRTSSPASLHDALFQVNQPLHAADSTEPIGTMSIAGSRIARFEVIRELGRGGLGMVLLAHDPVLNRQVALKIPRPEAVVTPNLRKRFHREGQAAARLLHPHIVPVYEVGQFGPVCFIAAAYIPGENLAQWLATSRAACTPRLAASIVADLADAMHYAHGQHILHRDLKPSNVLIERADQTAPGRVVAKITDFGLAKLLDERDDETRHGAVLGTPAYMAPEQAQGDVAQIGRASDVYSLGAILYEMLTGRAPFVGASEADTIAQLLGTEPVAPGRLVSGLSRDLEAICLRCLEKSPTKRFATAGDLAEDLRRYLQGEPTLTRPLSAPNRLARWARRKPALAGLVAVSIAALLTIAAGAFFYTRELQNALTLAETNASRAELNASTAKRHEARANEQLYVTQMKLADIALEHHRPADAERLLDAYGEGTPTAHVRGIEWYMLKEEVERVANRGPRNTTYNLPASEDVFCCDFTNDEKWLLTGGRTGVLCVWDVATRSSIYRLPTHGSCVNQLAVSPDGQHFATSSCDKTVRLWRLDGTQPPRIERSFSEHTGEVYGLTFSPDGKQLASGDTEGNLLLRNLVSGDLSRHNAKVRLSQLRWSADGKFIAIIRLSNEALVLETATGRMLRLGPPASAIAFGPGTSSLAVLDGSDIHLVDLSRSPTVSHKLDLFTDGVALDWSAPGNVLVSTARNHLILHDLTHSVKLAIDIHDSAAIDDVAISPNSSWVACVGRSGMATLTDIRPHTVGRQRYEYDLTSRKPDHRITADDASSVVVVQQREALVVDPERGGLRRRIALPNSLSGLFFSTRGEMLAAVHHEGIRLINVATAEIKELPPALIGDADKVLVSDEASVIVAVSRDRLRIFGRDTLAPRQEVRCDLSDDRQYLQLCLSPDGRYLAIDEHKQPKVLVDLPALIRREIPVTRAGSSIRVIGFTSDSNRVCVAEGDSILVRDCATLAVQQAMQLDNAIGLQHEASPDGRTLAITDPTMLRLVDIASGQELLSWAHPHLSDRCASFSSDGTRLRLAGVTGFGKFQIYEWTKGNAEACLLPAQVDNSR